MNTELQMVREFHKAFGQDKPAKLLTCHRTSLDLAATRTSRTAKNLMCKLDINDPRILRAQLMVEELSEVLEAMLKGHELELLDGLADLLYVVLGTALTFDLPIVAAFHEVHFSNMTKQHGQRGRVKIRGDKFKKPDLVTILERYRIMEKSK